MLSGDVWLNNLNGFVNLGGGAMRNSVFAVALLVLFLGCGCAWAAAPAAANYCWTGYYVGINTGFAKDASAYNIDPAAVSGVSDSFSTLAFIFGGQAGYNYQSGNFVYGLETDIDYEHLGETLVGNGNLGFFAIGPALSNMSSYAVTQEIDFFGTLRGRVGYTPADRLLLYVTGGLAYGEVSSSTSGTATRITFSGSESGMQVGWTVGTGGEYALSNNWSVKIEYLYVDLGSMSYNDVRTISPVTPLPTVTTTIDTVQHIFRVGLNYKF